MHPVRKREMGDTTLSYAVGNKGAGFSLAALPSPSSRSFRFYTLRPAAARGAEGAALRLHAFAKGSPFGGAGAKRLRGQARFRGGYTPV